MRLRNHHCIELTVLAALLAALSGAPALADTSQPSGGTSGPATAGQAGARNSDAWITTEVKAKLLAEHFRTGVDVKVTTNDGVVQLDGTVDRAKQITQAENIANSVKGVKRVDNNLKVK